MTIKINDPTFKDSTKNKSRIYVQKKFQTMKSKNKDRE